MITATLLLYTIVFFSECQCQIPKVTVMTEPLLYTAAPHWSKREKVLYYVNTPENTIYRLDPLAATVKSVTLDRPVSIVVPVKGERCKFIVTLGRDLVVLTWDYNTGCYQVSPPLVTVDQQSPYNIFHDGKADSCGRIFAGTIGPRDSRGNVQRNRATLYRVDNTPCEPCQADPIIRPVTISGGLAFTSDDKTFYYTDTPTRRIQAYDYCLSNGSISNQRVVFDFEDNYIEGSPGGMTIDSDENLWIACLGGSQVIQINPTTGQLLRQIPIPAQNVSSVVFGGRYLKSLYVTTIREGLSPQQLQQQPYAGSVYKVTGLNVIGTVSKNACINCNFN